MALIPLTIGFIIGFVVSVWSGHTIFEWQWWAWVIPACIVALHIIRWVDTELSDSQPISDSEICICAAIILDDGRIIRGHRHDDCIQTASKWKKAGQDIGKLSMEQQGFYTSKERFVDREEGLRIQRAAGRNLEILGSVLTSEDLY